MSDIAEKLKRSIAKAMDHAGTVPAKSAVKLRPADWNAVIDDGREAAAEITALRASLDAMRQERDEAVARAERLLADALRWKEMYLAAADGREVADAALSAKDEEVKRLRERVRYEHETFNEMAAAKVENHALREALHDLLTRPTDPSARQRARAALSPRTAAMEHIAQELAEEIEEETR